MALLLIIGLIARSQNLDDLGLVFDEADWEKGWPNGYKTGSMRGEGYPVSWEEPNPHIQQKLSSQLSASQESWTFIDENMVKYKALSGNDIFHRYYKDLNRGFWFATRFVSEMGARNLPSYAFCLPTDMAADKWTTGGIIGQATIGKSSNLKSYLRPMVSIPKSSYNLFEGGVHGEDYHIEPSDIEVDGLTRKVHNFTQMTPTNYSRTGESIDYVPTPPSSSWVLGIDYDQPPKDFPAGMLSEELNWKIWGEDNTNLYLISENPTNVSWPVNGSVGSAPDYSCHINTFIDWVDWTSNRACGSTKYVGAFSRSLKVEDLEYITENEVLHQGEYGTTPYTLTTKGMKYPQSWGYLGIGKVIQNRSNGMGSFAPVEYTSSVTEISPVMSAMNYTFRPNDAGLVNPKYYKLIVRDPENTGEPMWYWLASRYISGESTADGPKLYYGLLNIQGNKLSTGQLLSSAGEVSSVSGCGIRPVVIIPKESCTISMGGTNGETYHIAPKS